MATFKNFVLRKPIREKVKLSFVDLIVERDSSKKAKKAVDRFLETRSACETKVSLMTRMHSVWMHWYGILMLAASRKLSSCF